MLGNFLGGLTEFAHKDSGNLPLGLTQLLIQYNAELNK